MVPLAKYRDWCDLCGDQLLVTDVSFLYRDDGKVAETVSFDPPVTFTTLERELLPSGELWGLVMRYGDEIDGTAECRGCGEVEGLSDLKLD